MSPTPVPGRRPQLEEKPRAPVLLLIEPGAGAALWRCITGVWRRRGTPTGSEYPRIRHATQPDIRGENEITARHWDPTSFILSQYRGRQHAISHSDRKSGPISDAGNLIIRVVCEWYAMWLLRKKIPPRFLGNSVGRRRSNVVSTSQDVEITLESLLVFCGVDLFKRIATGN